MRKYLFGTTVLAGVMTLAVPAFAQTPPPAPQDQDEAVVDEIVVTGSRIRRDPATVPAPIITVQRESLLETGLPTVIDYLATIPALSNSLVPSDTTGSGLNDGGLEFANLRSLGAGRTLTLVDGRRHVGSQAGTLSVDVSTVPRLLIDNIEIITGGASSVYGADAVSGVINYTLRRDYEGLEIDANYGELTEGGDAATRRVSILGGINLLDDRLNLYAFAEYEKADEVLSSYLDWLDRGRVALGIDADPALTQPQFGRPTDGFVDTGEFFNARRLDRPVWGSTTLANRSRPSPLSDPDIPTTSAPCRGFDTRADCFNVNPGYTYWFDGPSARLANFGQRIGVTGANRPWNIGGDGEKAGQTAFDANTRFPEQESQRYQVGANFRISDNVRATLEAKFTTEDAFDAGQFSFWDIYVANASLGAGTGSATTPGIIAGTSTFSTRLDNAFLPANLRDAILANTFTQYGEPTLNGEAPITGTVAAPIALHRGFGIPRTQTNNRELQRYVAAIEGDYDRVGFINNFNWGLSFTYGRMDNLNIETGPDAIRFGHAMDSVVDTAGLVNGRPGEIVCRVRLLNAQGLPITEQNPFTDTDGNGNVSTRAGGLPEIYTDPNTNPEIAGCVPLNVFGAGNQSAEALDYISAFVRVFETNEQEAAVATFGGELWDFWGAGPIGFAAGAEYRREYTDGVGRNADTNNRLLQLNTGPDFVGAEYETEEFFAELAIPLIRDSWLGEFAELSGSYRAFDYTTAGSGDVYGVNLVYRPIPDITFKTSFNTAFRAPNLTENFRPFVQTFVNPPFTDPCDSRAIAGLQGDNAAEFRANRIVNCAALAAQRGLTYDFAQTTLTTADDYRPTYSSGIASSLGGNQGLRPETSESFTFSTVFRPRAVPDLSIVLDYYEITIDDVIVTPGGQAIAEACVNGANLDPVTCALVRRNNPNNDTDPFNVFKIGAPNGDAIGGFILQSLNFAKLETRGLDFTVNYGFESQDVFGMDIGRFDYSLGGLWLIEQKQFTSLVNPDLFTDLTTGVFYPRLEGTQRITWSPNDRLRVTWTADWMGAQDLVKKRNAVEADNTDQSPTDWWSTGNFVRHDLTASYNVNDDITVRGGVTNITDVEPPQFLGFASTFDPYGRRFFVGLNYRIF